MIGSIDKLRHPMKIKQDPITKLWCREDGKILMPPNGRAFKTFRWTFGSNDSYGYKQVSYRGKAYKVHQIICRAFYGLPSADKPCVDHINRIRHDNRYSNLHWASAKENSNNKGCVAQSIEKYGVRCCEDNKAYMRAWRELHREEIRASHRAWRKRRKNALKSIK